ncbi:adenylyltransferase/cytidyltransferase family protein [Actinoallomurus iriomotensis]|uniref:Transcriptional regulator n=1 Tax=Actinoallomurus iriomotensis TaxID=478107 RepID=A0A9W6RTT6_9ACTN|nr:adenylyltransferase/cytidyltransferase family protein [Actinoallomurus iriomotensis]GLY81568.1 hypothetical protein Airi01_098350 [Actinoallomurus iriomotensis]
MGGTAGGDARTGGDVSHGLVIGKFYPPHAGHHHLIDTAAARCDRLTVVVAASPVETIPIALRAAWLRERHPQPQVEIVAAVDDNEVDYDSDEVWAAHVAVFRAAAADPVDLVFSSEDYGPELAHRLDAVHVPVDPARTRHPVSGTAVRADPVACWEWLSPAVRAYLARRVVVVGAESSGTGKTHHNMRASRARARSGHADRPPPVQVRAGPCVPRGTVNRLRRRLSRRPGRLRAAGPYARPHAPMRIARAWGSHQFRCSSRVPPIAVTADVRRPTPIDSHSNGDQYGQPHATGNRQRYRRAHCSSAWSTPNSRSRTVPSGSKIRIAVFL